MSSKFPGGFVTKSPVAPTTSAASGIWTLDQQEQYQKAGTWPQQPPPPYIEDVFSTQVYTGTGATNNIVNGVDLATYGGLVWTKARTTTSAFTFAHALIDTLRGAGVQICSDRTDANYTQANSLTGFNTNGYTLGTDSGGQGRVNNTSYGTQTYASWTFRKQPKFFDVVTYTGNGVAGTQISHSLGSTPGCIMVKRYAGAGGAVDWAVWHNQLGGSEYLKLNTTDAGITNAAYPPFGAVTSTYFTVGNASATGNNGITNSNGDSFVAYVFAHNAGGFGLTGTDNVISCGFFMTDASANASVTLGYEPQWVLIKRIDGVGYWDMLDNMRGMTVGTSNAFLWANTSDAEMVGQRAQPFATGFNYNGSNSASYIYIAIRRGPMKVPTSGTSVYNADTTITATTPAAVSGFVTDLMISTNRTNKATYNEMFWSNRLTANGYTSSTNTTAEQAGGAFGAWDTMNGSGTSALQSAGVSDMAWMFRRAPSFFDEVCYTGNGTAGRTITHNLTVTPELIITKERSLGSYWYVYSQATGPTQYLRLESTNTPATYSGVWNNTAPTSSVFTVGSDGYINASGQTYVAYLFATCPGISKVGSYTGTGATQTISCGFAGGARFVLLKRTDSTGDWYVWDTARGMVSGTDPSLLLNSTAAEVNANSIYTITGGFQIVSTVAGINASGGSYIYLAIA